MTIFDSIKNKNIDELVDWIDKYFEFDTAPYWKWYDQNYCSECIAEIGFDNEGNEYDYAYCELNGKCRYFKDMGEIPNSKQTIKMWLESECN